MIDAEPTSYARSTRPVTPASTSATRSKTRRARTVGYSPAARCRSKHWAHRPSRGRHTHELTVAQYKSVSRLAAELPRNGGVSDPWIRQLLRGLGDGPRFVDVGEQRQINPALTQDETRFVDELLANLSALPAYYAHMGSSIERPARRRPVGARRVDPAELRRRIEAGEWVVDLRKRTAFAAGHSAVRTGSNCRIHS